MTDGLIQVNAVATGAACTRMTAAGLRALQDSVERACRLQGRPRWERKAAAHAEIFTLLGGMTDDPALTTALLRAADVVRHWSLAAGPAASGMIASSRQRLLAFMRAGDADGAAQEMERHLKGLYFMSRLAGDHPGNVRVSRCVLTSDLLLPETAA